MKLSAQKKKKQRIKKMPRKLGKEQLTLPQIRSMLALGLLSAKGKMLAKKALELRGRKKGK
jgi:hypothetical protein